MPRPGGMLSVVRRLAASAYLLVVMLLAVFGFITGTTSVILLAVVLTLPASLAAVPLYYVLFGLLAQVPGASPASSAGGAMCRPHRGCQAVHSSGQAIWFSPTATVIGIVLLVAAAVFNVMVLPRLIATYRRSRARQG